MSRSRKVKAARLKKTGARRSGRRSDSAALRAYYADGVLRGGDFSEELADRARQGTTKKRPSVRKPITKIDSGGISK